MTALDDKVFLVSTRWSHHASHSGYDLLGKYVGRPLASSPMPDFLLPERLISREQRTMKGYDRTSAALELLAVRHMASHRGCLYHVLYGDSCYNYLGHLKGWRGHRVIASYHHPPRKFAEFVQKREALGRLSAAIVLGRNQYSSFEGILPRERVLFIPHPIDTSYYTPPDDFSQRKDGLCLFVGAHLRDLATLRFIIEDARILAPQLRFAVVAHPRHLDKFEGVAGNFALYSSIDDRQLLSLYQKATLLIQPLLDVVANNALLEAMSCGLPTIVTDIGAVRDYAHEDCAYFVPPYNPEAMLDAILDLVHSPGKRERMAAHARERALLFDWHVVAQQMCKVYEQVLSSA